MYYSSCSNIMYYALYASNCRNIMYYALTAEPESSTVTVYWEAGRLMSAAVETNSDVYILEVGLIS